MDGKPQTQTKITISLKPELIEFANVRIASGFTTRSGYIASLIRADKQRHDAKLKRDAK